MPNKQRRNRISQHITSTALRGPFQNEIFFCLKKLWETTNRIKLTNKPILFYYSFFTYLIHPPTQLVSLFLSPEYNVKKCIMLCRLCSMCTLLLVWFGWWCDDDAGNFIEYLCWVGRVCVSHVDSFAVFIVIIVSLQTNNFC